MCNNDFANTRFRIFLDIIEQTGSRKRWIKIQSGLLNPVWSEVSRFCGHFSVKTFRENAFFVVGEKLAIKGPFPGPLGEWWAKPAELPVWRGFLRVWGWRASLKYRLWSESSRRERGARRLSARPFQMWAFSWLRATSPARSGSSLATSGARPVVFAGFTVVSAGVPPSGEVRSQLGEFWVCQYSAEYGVGCHAVTLCGSSGFTNLCLVAGSSRLRSRAKDARRVWVSESLALGPPARSHIGRFSTGAVGALRESAGSEPAVSRLSLGVAWLCRHC